MGAVVSERVAVDQIYMDNMSTTPVDPRVVEAMLCYFHEEFGNAHSVTHDYGYVSMHAVGVAREHIANLIGADPREIIFTSGATEANNLAIRGVADFYSSSKKHIITSAIEHKCVLESCRFLENNGFEVTYLPVNDKGILDPAVVADAIRDDTSLVSIMFVNNEIGVIQDIAAIGEICRERGVFFHTDAAQGFGKLPMNVKDMKIDLMSISAHKVYGPKGIGALYVGRKPRVRLVPIIKGGGQERGMRSGTLPTPLCVGFGEATRLAALEMDQNYAHVKHLGDKLLNTLLGMEMVYLNGDLEKRYPGCVNVSFACIEGESMIAGIRGIAVSSGSACTSDSLEGSYVLNALGVTEDLAHTSIRFGLGKFTTEKEIDETIECVSTAVVRLRELSPLWDMVKEGIDLSKIEWASH